MDASNSTIDWLFHTLSFLILNVSWHFALKTAVWPMFVLDSFGVCQLLWNIPFGMLQVYLGMHGSRSRHGRMAVYSQQPTMCWAPGHRGVCPQWWRPIQTAGKLSTAPCTALLPYSWPCGLLIIHKGKPWTHQIPRLTGFFILCPSWFLMSVGTLLSRQQSGQCLFWIVLVFVNYCGTFLLGCCKYLLACMVHVVDVDAWLCILSSPPCVGHLVIMVYVRSGGVLYRLLASWVLLLARHCFHIPGPVGYW